MSDLKATINAAMIDCMKAGRKVDLGVIRLIQAGIKQREVDERITLTDEQVLALLDKMVRQRRDAIQQFSAAGRSDLVSKEEHEIVVIQQFMPKSLDKAEIDGLITAAIASVKPQSIRDMAKVMAVLKPQLQGRADMGMVSQQVKDILNTMAS